METPFSNLGLVIFGTYVSIFALLFDATKIHGFPIAAVSLHGNEHLQSLPPPPTQPPVAPPPSGSHRPHRSKPPPPRRPPPNRFPSPSINGSNRGQKSIPPPPPSASGKMNTGKIVGFSFLGIAGVLQIAAVGFLAIKRRQLV